MGTYKHSAFKAASIYDPATGDKAQMNTLLAPETKFYEPEIIEQPITNGAYQSGWRYKVDFASSDWDAYDQLRAFKDANTNVRAVAAGAGKGSKNLQWYESVEIAELRRVPKGLRSEGDSYFLVSLVFIGGENAAIYNNVNLLHQANVNGVTVTGFVDGDADGLADGWTTSNIQTKTFATGVQNLTTSNTTISYFRRAIEFPIPDISFRFRVTGTLNSGGANIKVEQDNFAGSELTESQVSFTTGNMTVLDKTYSGTYKVICSAPAVILIFDVDVTDLSLRVDGSSEYIAG